MRSDAEEHPCATYKLGPTKDGRTITITVHSHDCGKTHWYEVIVPMKGGSTKRACSEYWWADERHALAAAFGRYSAIENQKEGEWEDTLIPGAVRRVGTA